MDALGKELDASCEELFASFQCAARDLGMNEPEAVALALLVFQMFAARLAAFPMVFDGADYPEKEFSISALQCAAFARDAVRKQRSVMQ